MVDLWRGSPLKPWWEHSYFAGCNSEVVDGAQVISHLKFSGTVGVFYHFYPWHQAILSHRGLGPSCWDLGSFMGFLDSNLFTLW